MTVTDEYERQREDRIIIDHNKCQGCGSCVTACPNGGFRVVNGKAKIINENFCDGLGYCIQMCPMQAITFNEEILEDMEKFCKYEPHTQNWPVKLPLINTKHAQFKNADLLIVADCAPIVLRNFSEISDGKVVLTVCPKIGNPKDIREKLTQIIEQNTIKTIESLNVDYICCENLPRIVKDAVRFSNKKDSLMPNYKNKVVCLFGIAK